MTGDTSGRPLGRPALFDEKTAEEFCERLANGRSMRSIVQDEDMPSWTTIWRWLQQDMSFRARYARAREIQAHYIAETAHDEAVIADDAQLGRLALDARKWFAAKLAPKVYGDKISQEISGPNGDPIEVREIRRVVVDPRNTDT